MYGIRNLREKLDAGALGRQMYELLERLYPICRSITGEGFRETQRIVAEHVRGLELRGVPSGTQCFDWIVPKEWNIRDAYVKAPSGEKVIDFRKSNLHVLNYSVPVRAKLTLAELDKHLYTLPEQPSWIPYRTSYYKEDWGFCLAHDDYRKLEDGVYEVVIDSTLEDGDLNYGECLLLGESSREVLLSCHACHPSLCNDNLSGIVVSTFLAKLLADTPTRYSHRFVWIPGGIGSVVWMSQNQERLWRIAHGLVLTCLGDPGNFTYKKSRRGDAEIDRAVQNVLRQTGDDFAVLEFSPYGYDERNYGSQKFDLPVGSLTRSTHEGFAGYHSSADDLSLVRPEALGDSLLTYLAVLDVLENNGRYRNRIPEAEPQLGRRGLYGMQGGLQKRERLEMALLWVMNFSDGEHSLLEISDRSGYSFELISDAAGKLLEHGLLERWERDDG